MKCTKLKILPLFATTLIFISSVTADQSFVLSSPAVVDGGQLPQDYTGDGTSSTLPLEWRGEPAGTKSYAVIMHHIDPEGKTKWYWILYNIPADVTRLPKNVKGVGTLGNNSINHRAEYAPPHSKAPLPKTYIYTVYALSALPKMMDGPPVDVSREVLLTAMNGLILGSAEFKVVYTSQARSMPAPAGDQRKPWLQIHGAELANQEGVITLEAILDDANRAFAIYDRNHDGVITAEELKATGDVREGTTFAGLIYRHFVDLDTNGDGKVSREELLAAVKYIFNTADLNHTGKLTPAEWQNSPDAPLPIRK